eukprot:UC4_evm11s1434
MKEGRASTIIREDQAQQEPRLGLKIDAMQYQCGDLKDLPSLLAEGPLIYHGLGMCTVKPADKVLAHWQAGNMFGLSGSAVANVSDMEITGGNVGVLFRAADVAIHMAGEGILGFPNPNMPTFKVNEFVSSVEKREEIYLSIKSGEISFADAMVIGSLCNENATINAEVRAMLSVPGVPKSILNLFVAFDKPTNQQLEVSRNINIRSPLDAMQRCVNILDCMANWPSGDGGKNFIKKALMKGKAGVMEVATALSWGSAEWNCYSYTLWKDQNDDFKLALEKLLMTNDEFKARLFAGAAAAGISPTSTKNTSIENASIDSDSTNITSNLRLLPPPPPPPPPLPSTLFSVKTDIMGHATKLKKIDQRCVNALILSETKSRKFRPEMNVQSSDIEVVAREQQDGLSIHQLLPQSKVHSVAFDHDVGNTVTASTEVVDLCKMWVEEELVWARNIEYKSLIDKEISEGKRLLSAAISQSLHYVAGTNPDMCVYVDARYKDRVNTLLVPNLSFFSPTEVTTLLQQVAKGAAATRWKMPPGHMSESIVAVALKSRHAGPLDHEIFDTLISELGVPGIVFQ